MSNNPFFLIDQGQITPTLDAALFDAEGQLVNLAGASVVFQLYELGGTLLFERSATVVSAADGHARYSWQSGDTAEVGRYLGKFVVTYSSLEVQEFPENKYIRIDVG